MADQFDTYLKLLDLVRTNKTKNKLREAITAAGIEINETEPHSGYYRCAAVKDGPLLPVAIWRDEGGKLQVLRGGEAVALERVWPYCVWNPISYDWYELVAEKGESWPDAHVDQPVERAAAAESAEDAPAPTGHNKPPEEDEVERAKREIETAAANAGQYKEITDEDTAAAAQALRSRLNELSNQADKRRKYLMQPHKDAADKIHKVWQPLVLLAKEGADAILQSLKAYETKKYQAEQEARRKAEEEARKAAEEAEKKGEPAPEPAVEPEDNVAPITAGTIKGASGRAATVRTRRVAKVVDYDRAYLHLRAVPEVKQVIEKVAQRLVTAGNEVPGVEVHEERDVA